MIAGLIYVGGHIQISTGYEPNAQGSSRGGGQTWMRQAVGGTGPWIDIRCMYGSYYGGEGAASYSGIARRNYLLGFLGA